MVEYLRRNAYANPSDGGNGPFQYAFDTDLSFFQFLHQDPRRMKNFNTYMTGNRGLRSHWSDWFPVEVNLIGEWRATSGDCVFLVDMGGGKGHDLKRLVSTFPQVAGRVVLQDLPGTIASVQNHEGTIKLMAHDLFDLQPVEGAKAYYTHFLLHDFPDEACRAILRNVAAAMEPAYSRLLLNEILLPDEACPSFFAAANITMMTNLAALNRSKSEWIDLLYTAGFEVQSIMASPDEGDCEVVIDAIQRTSYSGNLK